MRHLRYLAVALAIVSVPLGVGAQAIPVVGPSTFSFTAASQSNVWTCNAGQSSFALTVPAGLTGTFTVTVSQTLSGTYSNPPWAYTPGSGVYTNTLTNSGALTVSLGSNMYVKVADTSYTSGSATVTGSCSSAVATRPPATSGDAAASVPGSGTVGPIVIAQATSQPTIQPGYSAVQASIVGDGQAGGLWDTCFGVTCTLGANGYDGIHHSMLWMNFPGDTLGNSDIAIGGAALGSGDAGTFGHNIAIGVGALEDAGGTIPGQNNVAIGFVSMRYADTTAAQANVAVGNTAGDCISTGQENTFVGTGAGTGTCTGSGQGTYSFNTALGYNSGVDLASSATYNSFVGFQSGDTCSTCTDNVAEGALALGAVTTQSGNTAVGYNANGLGTGTGNTVVGSGAGKNISGNNNVVVGESAAVGAAASTAAQNVYIGGVTGGSTIASGSQNVVVGYGAALNFTTAAGNTILGAGDADITSGASNVELGSGANVASASGNYQLSIMNAIYGKSNSGSGSTLSAGCIAFYANTCTNGTVAFAVPISGSGVIATTAHNACGSSSGVPCETTMTCSLSSATSCSGTATVPASSICAVTANGSDTTTGVESFKASLATNTLTVTATVASSQTTTVAANVTCL